MIIGITGAFGSGKSTAAKLFENKGYRKISLAEKFLEPEARRQGAKKITRKMLQDIGNQWRKIYGSAILAKKAVSLFKKDKSQNVVVDGIRNIGEIDELRKLKNFILIAIIADRKFRFERLRKLKRREELTWELFSKLDRRDLGLGQKNTGLKTAECIAIADVFINNNSNLESFNKRLKEFLESME